MIQHSEVVLRCAFLLSYESKMDSPTLTTIVLAAGEGTRMRSALPKVLHPLCGRPLLGHVLAAADALGSHHTTVVLAQDTIERVRNAFGEQYHYVVQKERLGTGHAALQARDLLRGKSDDVLVLLSDAPLLRPETVQAVVESRRAAGALMALLSFEANPPTGYGRVVRDAAGHVCALVEERNATPEQRAICEVNSGIMCFKADWLWEAIDRIERNPVNQEYYLTDMVTLAVEEQGPGAALAIMAADPGDALGVNDRAQLAQAEAIMRARILDTLMRGGVTITDPAATYVDIGVTVGRDTTLLPGTLLRGATRVGSGCIIGPHTTLVDTTVGDRAQLVYALIEHTSIPAEAQIGPFAHIAG